jgi:pyruvate formate lyase activating enzyme
MSVGEVMEVLARDRAYYAQSGGGVTFSGGEPTLQSVFLLGLLKACKAARIHTAIETSGFVDWPVLEQLLFSIDLVVYDLKCLDPIRHENFTGKRNETILENLIHIASVGNPPIALHIPVIPHYNDSDEYLGQLAQYLMDIGLRDVEFLPFHKLGSHEYDEIGQRYPLENMECIPSYRMEEIRERFRSLGFRVNE